MTARDQLYADHVAFYERCGHCGGCGGPDGYCCCNGACGCRDLHPPGEPDPLSRYSVAGVDQGELF